MIEPYYEEEMPIINGVRYPFHCFCIETAGKKIEVSPHWHYYIEILYFLEGTAGVILGDERYQISEGDFVIINSREVHSTLCITGINTRYLVIKFDVDMLYTTAEAAFEAKYIMPFTISNHPYRKVFRKNEIENTRLKAIALEINQEYYEKNYGYELAVRMGIGTLFLHLLRIWENDGIIYNLDTIPNLMDIKKLQHLLDYLDLHYNENISVRDMAKMCNVSYCYFSRFFKKVMQKTFVEYLNYIRISEAKRLLLSTDLNITEVALKVGFTSSSYFIEQFKTYHNQSPKQFKKKALMQG